MFRAYGLTDDEIAPVVRALEARPKAWVDFMMRFELGLEEPDPPARASTARSPSRAPTSPADWCRCVPYMVIHDTRRALPLSAGFTLVALLLFGIVKGRFTGVHPVRAGFQTVLVGGLAAAAAFGLAKLFS